MDSVMPVKFISISISAPRPPPDWVAVLFLTNSCPIYPLSIPEAI
jgi:hypothetical protein